MKRRYCIHTHWKIISCDQMYLCKIECQFCCYSHIRKNICKCKYMWLFCLLAYEFTWQDLHCQRTFLTIYNSFSRSRKFCIIWCSDYVRTLPLWIGMVYRVSSCTQNKIIKSLFILSTLFALSTRILFCSYLSLWDIHVHSEQYLWGVYKIKIVIWEFVIFLDIWQT